MACYKAAVIFGLLLCVSVCAGELEFSGHETPQYVGLAKIITCRWTGLENITKIDWYLFGLEGLGLGIEFGHPYTTALNPGRVTDISWNGKMFVCKATTVSGSIVRKKLTLWVKELLNEITITPPCESTCEEAPTAGDSHTLTCNAESEQPTTLSWERIISETEQVVVESTPNITFSTHTKFGLVLIWTKKSITFDPLLTSHAGKYACVSVLHNDGPKVIGTSELECVIKVKIPPPCVELKNDSEADTCTNVTLTPLIEVHTDIPTDIESRWYGHLSLNDSPRVTISNRSVQFTPLKSSDEGTYSFSARVKPLDSKYLCPSSFVNNSTDISPSLCVIIDVEYTRPADFNLISPPNYKTNTDVTFTCRVEGASGIVKYQWSSTAENKLPADSNSTVLTKNMLNSYDTGNYTCTATDANNNTGSGTTEVDVIGLLVHIDVERDCHCTFPCHPYFLPATSVNLICRVEGSRGPFSYQWSSTGLNSFVVNSRSSIVSKLILTSDDAGSHTCHVNDSDGNVGSRTIEMKMEGGGIFVAKSSSHNNVSLANNSMVTFNSRSRIIDFVCYTNSSDPNVGYIILPDNKQYNDTEQVRTISPSGIQFQNNNYRLRVNTGIYTCRLPDSNGKILDFNLGVYTSAIRPYISSYRYIDHIKNESNTLLGVIEIQTRYSPPTDVTCKIDEEIVVEYPCMKKDGYEAMQVITDRRRSYYTTYIQIRNVCDLLGRNYYTCEVDNYAGSRSSKIRTDLKVEKEISLENTTEPVYNDTFVLTCTATLLVPPKLARYLLQQPIIEWVGPNGKVLKSSDGIIVGDQIALQNKATKTLTFSSLNYAHEGQYICRTNICGTNKVESKQQSFTIKVIERTILQLKFGPLPHCSNWYKEKHISEKVESDLRKTIEEILLEDCKNACTLHHRLLTEVRFSCQTSTSCVTFRATLIGSRDTMGLHDMLMKLSDWLCTDGTFIYTYNSRIRLRADRECPLTIKSFCVPECGGRECLFRNMTIPTVNHHPYTHLFG